MRTIKIMTLRMTLAAFGLAALAMAASPVTITKTRITYKVDANGQLTPSQTDHVTFARASDGREVTRSYLIVNGQIVPTSALIRDNGRATLVSYDKKTYRAFAQPAPPSPQLILNQKGERQVYSGVTCVVIPMRDRTTGQQTGSACHSPEYGIPLHSDMEVIAPGGVKIRIVEELTSIRSGEPDAREFDIPAGFQATDALGPDCPTCVK